MVSRFDALAGRILAQPPRLGSVRLVAIDGPGGAGKSVFAARLGRALGDAPVIHTDDFAAWDDQFDWWPGLERQVLAPLAAGRPASFRPRDWDRGGLRDEVRVPAQGVVLLEGVSSGRRVVAARLSLLAWVETAPTTRLRRGLERDGEAMRSQWDTWMAAEDAHYAADPTRARADVVVVGDPVIEYDPDTSFVAIGPGALR